MQSTQFIFEAIGTRWIIDCHGIPQDRDQQEISNAIKKRIADFDQAYSRFRSDSLIYTMSEKQGRYTVPDDAESLLELYHHLYTITDGAFTPLIGKTLEEAGYDNTYSLKKRTLHRPPFWEEVINYTHPYVTIKKPALLDFGAAGKGHIVDIIGDLLTPKGIPSFCIDAGGDILYKNSQDIPLRVGLEHPENPKQVIGIATITNQAICGSSGNRRQWGEFHHIIHPGSLSSPRHILATWVIADTAIVADALATCLFFTDPITLQKYYNFEYFLLLPDYSIDQSFAFPAEVFYNENHI